MQKEHYKNLLDNPPEMTDKLIQIVINGQQVVKMGESLKEFDAVFKKRIKTEKPPTL